MKRPFITLVTCLIVAASQSSAKDYTVTSPNGKLSAKVADEGEISIEHNGKNVVTVSTGIVLQQFTQSKLSVYPRQTVSLPSLN